MTRAEAEIVAEALANLVARVPFTELELLIALHEAQRIAREAQIGRDTLAGDMARQLGAEGLL